MSSSATAAFLGVGVFLAFAVVALSRAPPPDATDTAALSAGALYANVALTHGTLLVVVAGAAWLFGVPLTLLGVGTRPLSEAVFVGVLAGLLLAVGNVAAARAADALGVPYSDALTDLLTPDSAGGWVALLGGVLPLVALAEELLFRAALVGALAGFDTPVVVAVAFSSVLFGLAHGAQGVAGVVVAGSLGVALAAVFVATNSLAAVVVAHAVVNAVELVGHATRGD
ncbi:CPBP family intramembrane glutamic endopeptidase [Salarchaeum sp. JOR-1]|uniref:CPBP family intramembrane glutamic endopeptidase n=1 Tax=Salarchaeum sp. JOR-1 TaxID=2599399 RepID=UPI0011988DCD|nr:CPBP family intramembrane glutamic endopeptidase [Salarchaeum sp. JOR-1]QDX39769.1 CPBP family intramembrane metalloprotease [Salarchaeum sp. JOR-1]